MSLEEEIETYSVINIVITLMGTIGDKGFCFQYNGMCAWSWTAEENFFTRNIEFMTVFFLPLNTESQHEQLHWSLSTLSL